MTEQQQSSAGCQDDNIADNDVVTAVDIVNQQEALEREAKEVLPGKFETCTFNLGYIRQALYACKTCTTPDDEPAGMCYSCSIACHSNHELYELFPKRNFRCDCGVRSKFNGHACTLSLSSKLATTKNDYNQYNHNFRGRYCWCDEVYDPDVEEGTMFQCLVCEDWFHDRCIGDVPPELTEFESYVCSACTRRYPFLVTKPSPWMGVGLSKDKASVHKWLFYEHGKEKRCNDVVEESLPDTMITGEKRKLSDPLPDETDKRQKMDEAICQRATLVDDENYASLFLKEGWRDHLCQCQACAKAYIDNHLDFMLQEEETYEPEEDEDADKSWLDIGMQHLERMGRFQAIESVLAYKKLSSQIMEFLATFKETGKVVTENDIKQFFEEKRLEHEKEGSP